MPKQEEVFVNGELEEFSEHLLDTVVHYNISIETIQKCLPVMGHLRDRGHDPFKILTDFSMKKT